MSKVAIVTGIGKRRIGWHVAEALAQRGYHLVVTYRTSATEAAEAVMQFESLGVQALAIEIDLSQEQEVRQLVQKTLDRFGRVDVLVQCAGLWKSKPLEEVSAQDVREHFEVNVLATFLCCREVGLAMVGQAEGGNLITLGDWAEVRPYPDYAAYFASKGAIPTLTRSLAVELGTRNPRVRVNCIHPGPVLLPAEMPESVRRQVIEATLVKREGHPRNIAQTVLFLIDNDFVTGACVPVDGGRSIYAGQI